jgi:Kef-type K+ transport system membrane component KefB/nucleotide-binding universal stress UspA family protein
MTTPARSRPRACACTALTSPEVTEPQRSQRGVVALYVAMAVLAVAAVIAVLSVADGREPHPEIAGTYAFAEPDACFGSDIVIAQSGSFLNLSSAEEDGASGKGRFDDGEITADVSCAEGGEEAVDLTVEDEVLRGTVGGREAEARFAAEPPPAGSQAPRPPDDIHGEYVFEPRSACIGGKGAIEERGGGSELEAGGAHGELAYADGAVTGEVTCADGSEAELAGEAAGRKITFTLEGAELEERVTATEQREFGHLLAQFFLIVAVVMVVARLAGAGAARLGQPRVMGEVVAGIALGPTLFGAVAPGLQSMLFPSDVLPYIGVAANLGLIFYMFLVGLELDPAQLKGRVGQAAAISNVSVVLPMVLGLIAGIPVYHLVGPDTEFLAFALFMGVSMSVTAFPVLARILVERRMLKRPVGALAISCAAIDDVTAWLLIALATTVAVAGSASEVLKTLAFAVAFCLFMAFAVRPVLSRVSTAYDEAGRVPSGWIAAIFAGVLLSAYTTETIGIALIIGAFVMGMIMPRRAGLTEDVTHRIEDFVVTLLLPLFFTYTGLRTDIGLLDRPELWLLTVGLIAVAMVGKLVGAAIAARVVGFGWRPAGVIGVLMNTRGLTELIVLNLALEAGVISEALFASLVIMALVTTLMAGPALKLIDPRNEFGAPIEDDLEEAKAEAQAAEPGLVAPDRSILVAASSSAGLDQLLCLARPLAKSVPPRELIMARLVPPPRGASVRGALQTENRLLEETHADLTSRRADLARQQIAARGVAAITADAGADLDRLARREEVDLVLMDGRRPLLGGGVPRGHVGHVLEKAPSDVAVLVAPEGVPILQGTGGAIVVPFGGAEHDWAALELAAWLGAATQMPIKLLGAAGQSDESKVTRLLGDAGLLVQQYAGVSAQPVVAEPGREGILAAAGEAGILIIGLSERWRTEGLGGTRSAIASAAPAPVLFVRRGTRPGALAPSGSVTQFGWSTIYGG